MNRPKATPYISPVWLSINDAIYDHQYAKTYQQDAVLRFSVKPLDEEIRFRVLKTKPSLNSSSSTTPKSILFVFPLDAIESVEFKADRNDGFLRVDIQSRKDLEEVSEYECVTRQDYPPDYPLAHILDQVSQGCKVSFVTKDKEEIRDALKYFRRIARKEAKERSINREFFLNQDERDMKAMWDEQYQATT